MAEIVFHSSGSTGNPKEIVRTEASLLEDASRLVENFPEIWGTVPISPLVVSSVRREHMYGALWCVRAPSIAGLAVHSDIVLSVEQLIEIAGTVPINSQSIIFVTTPTFVEKAVSHPDFCSLKGSFRAIVTSGGPLRGKTAALISKIVGVCPLEIYGSTEAGSVAWRRQTETDEICTLMPDVSAQIGVDGRLIVDSPFAMERPLVMGDLAEMRDARHFILRGRADRRVKILEQYVALTPIEEELIAHPFVEQVRVEPYGEGVQRLGALIVPTKEGRDCWLRDGASGMAAVFRSFLKGKTEAVAIPRRFRQVRELPVNERGKTTAAAARAVLTSWCREPIVTDWRAMSDSLTAELVFTEDMECFHGHFPGLPILPGVAQLYFIRHFAQQVFPDWPEAATYRALKFQKLIKPGVPVSLKLERREAGRFAFELAIAAGRCTSGTVGK